jgi:hypothetical protein
MVSGFGDDRIRQRSDALDVNGDLISRLQTAGRLAREPDPGGSPGNHLIARFQRNHGRDKLDQLRDLTSERSPHERFFRLPSILW